jgi:hypothetical protein
MRWVGHVARMGRRGMNIEYWYKIYIMGAVYMTIFRRNKIDITVSTFV